METRQQNLQGRSSNPPRGQGKQDQEFGKEQTTRLSITCSERSISNRPSTSGGSLWAKLALTGTLCPHAQVANPSVLPAGLMCTGVEGKASPSAHCVALTRISTQSHLLRGCRAVPSHRGLVQRNSNFLMTASRRAIESAK